MGWDAQRVRSTAEVLRGPSEMQNWQVIAIYGLFIVATDGRDRQQIADL